MEKKYTIDVTDKPRYQRHNTKMAIQSMGMDKSISETPEHYELMKGNKAEWDAIAVKEKAIQDRMNRMVENRDNKQSNVFNLREAVMSDGRNSVLVSLVEEDGRIRPMTQIQDDAKSKLSIQNKPNQFVIVGRSLQDSDVALISKDIDSAIALNKATGKPVLVNQDMAKSVDYLKANQPGKPIIAAGALGDGQAASLSQIHKEVRAAYPVFARSEKALKTFNDLSTKSSLGKGAVSRQLNYPVTAATYKPGLTRSAEHKQTLSVRR
jgi:hypothetical protein